MTYELLHLNISLELDLGFGTEYPLGNDMQNQENGK